MYKSLQNSPKTMARIEQIRLEECTDASDREVAHENKLHSAMRISQSWEDLTIMVDSPNKVSYFSFFGTYLANLSLFYSYYLTV